MEHLPKEVSWKTYLQMGSGQGFKTVSDLLAEKGYINQSTGRPYTRVDVRYRAYSYALDIETRDDARKDFARVWERVKGAPLTDDEWNKWLVKTAKSIFYQRPQKYERWIKQNGFQRYAQISTDVR
jgi:hypothetical protein